MPRRFGDFALMVRSIMFVVRDRNGEAAMRKTMEQFVQVCPDRSVAKSLADADRFLAHPEYGLFARERWPEAGL